MKKIATSGGYDPLHPGHIEMFQMARALGDHLTVIVEHDKWVSRKHKVLMPQAKRAAVIRELRYVDEVICNPNPVGNSGPLMVLNNVDIYAIGADHLNHEELPEYPSCKYGIEIINLGRIEDKQSSSAYIAGVQWDNPIPMVAGVLRSPGQMGIMVATRVDNDKLELPGGFVEQDETLEKAILREVDEELSMIMFAVDYRCSMPGKYRDGRKVLVSAFTGYVHGTFSPSKEIKSIQWVLEVPVGNWDNPVDLAILKQVLRGN